MFPLIAGGLIGNIVECKGHMWTSCLRNRHRLIGNIVECKDEYRMELTEDAKD